MRVLRKIIGCATDYAEKMNAGRSVEELAKLAGMTPEQYKEKEARLRLRGGFASEKIIPWNVVAFISLDQQQPLKDKDLERALETATRYERSELD